MSKFVQEHYCDECGGLLFKSAKGLVGEIEVKCKAKSRTGANSSQRCNKMNVLSIVPAPAGPAYSSKRARIQNDFKSKKQVQGQ